MYLIVFAWLYVALLVALSSHGVLGGVLGFLFGGLLPMALLLWIFGSPARRREAAKKEDVAEPNAKDNKKPL